MTRAQSFISCMFSRLRPIAPRGALSSCTLLLQEGKLSVSAHIKSTHEGLVRITFLFMVLTINRGYTNREI